MGCGSRPGSRPVVVPNTDGHERNDELTDEPREHLVEYTKELLSAGRLEELSSLTCFLGRECAGRRRWHAPLRAFARQVDELVLKRYGSRFKLLERMIRTLAIR